MRLLSAHRCFVEEREEASGAVQGERAKMRARVRYLPLVRADSPKPLALAG